MAGRKPTGNVSVKVRLSPEQLAWLTGDGSRSVQAGLQACVKLAMNGEPQLSAAIAPEPTRKPSKPKPAPAMPAILPAANRGERWVCQRKDCNRKPVNFTELCSCCGNPR